MTDRTDKVARIERERLWEYSKPKPGGNSTVVLTDAVLKLANQA
jgi:hypothetical protein